MAAIGITNQRETTVVWDRTHRPAPAPGARLAGPAHGGALRRTGGRGHLPLVRRTTGLVLDPYFSATKLEWLLTEGGVAAGPDLAFGTVDSWVLWKLTGGPAAGVHATEASNASRTMLFDIRSLAWADELTDLFGVPAACLPEVRPSAGRFGVTAPGTPVPGRPHCRHPRRPAGGAVRPGVLRPRG